MNAVVDVATAFFLGITNCRYLFAEKTFMPNPYTFAEFKKNFPADKTDVFFKEMGWDKLIGDKNYENTCAMRVSVCLVRLGMSFPTGEIKILKGKHKGKRVKIRWNELENVLTKAWGKPTAVTPTTAEGCKKYQGVIVFEKLPADDQGDRYPGHIKTTCLYGSYFGSDKIRVFEAKVENK